jgi:DNA-binding transcriptional LysR family regulator
MDRFREIETFVGVVEAGSFVQAADKLRISKSVASRIVAELEDRLDGRLLQRTTRKLSLTEAGQAYYERCLQILDELQEADSAVGRFSAEAVGLLKVNAPLTFGTLYLARCWGAFLERYPKVRLDVTLMDRQVDLVSEGFDLAVRITAQLQESSLIASKLASSKVVMCASPDYLEMHGVPQSPGDLARHEMISYSYYPWGDTVRLASEDRAEGVKVSTRLRVNNGDTCRAAALDGLGIILQPTFIVGRDLADGKLVEILPQWHTDEVGVYAVYPVRRHLSGKVRALVDYLSAAFRTEPWNTLGG